MSILPTLTDSPVLALENHLKTATVSQKIVQSRQTWIDTLGFQLVAFYPEFFGVVIAKINSAGGVSSVFFKDKATKPCQSVAFLKADDFKDYVENWALNEQKLIDNKKKLASMTMTLQDYIALDDVFRASWGCDCTYLDYYQVVGFKGKSIVLLRQINSQVVESDPKTNSGTCKPAINDFINDKIIEKRVTTKIGKNGEFKALVKIDELRTAFFKPKEQDGTHPASYWNHNY